MRALLIGLVALAGGGAPAAESSALDAAHALTRKATAAMIAQEAERAERLFRIALERVDDFPPARLGLGTIALARGDHEKALADYLAAKRGYERLGSRLIEVERERYEDALETIAELEGEVSEHRRRLERRGKPSGGGRAAEALRVREGQIQQLRLVRPLEPGAEGVPAEVHYHLGNALYRLRQFRPAVDAWRTCVAKLPEFAPAHRNLAVGLITIGRRDEARRSAEAARRLGMEIAPELQARLDEAAAPPED